MKNFIATFIASFLLLYFGFAITVAIKNTLAIIAFFSLILSMIITGFIRQQETTEDLESRLSTLEFKSKSNE